MKHPFKDVCYDVDALLSGVTKLSTFCSRLEKQGLLYPARFTRDTYVGMGFESFGEILIVNSPIDKRIDAIDYVPITDNDMGVDGGGLNRDDEAHTFQFKYRSFNDKLLTANRDHISNFVAHSLLKYDAKSMTIITTAKDLHNVIATEMYQDQVRTIGYKSLQKLVDGNLQFWKIFQTELNNTP